MVLRDSDNPNVRGMVFDIKRYAISDGPGIRTTVFLKGCPLRCKWCHNPESLKSTTEPGVRINRCIGCGRCIDVCPENAISVSEKVLTTDAEKCTRCCKCSEVCTAEARYAVGEMMSAQEVIAEVEKDALFYETSGGGVTFSGGEPLAQADFLYELLCESKNLGIHTAVDTSCYAGQDVLKRISEQTDMFLCDIKHMDDKTHREITGVGNKGILENIRWLGENGKAIIIRIPCIGGVNDSDENISATGEFIRLLKGVLRVDVLEYNEGGVHKDARLIGEDNIIEMSAAGEGVVSSMASKLESLGLNVRIGGK